MIRSISTPLPSAPEGWFVYQYQLLSDGRLAAVWTDRDIRTEYRKWWSRRQELNSSEKMPNFWDGKAQVVVINESGACEPISIPLVRGLIIDRFSDGRWLVTSSRAGAGEINARILKKDGQPIRSLALGDGIEYVRCAQDGTIWVGYFDEGIFGGSVASGGLVQFDDFGRPLWSYNKEGGGRKSFIADCYALTLDGNAIWTCFYTDFPIVRLKDDRETLWTNSKVSGSRALAVDGEFVLLAGGYEADAGRLALLMLAQGEAKLLGAFTCPEIANADLLAGHASMIHFVKNELWSRISVSDAQSELK
jgi:hypothetical protein